MALEGKIPIWAPAAAAGLAGVVLGGSVLLDKDLSTIASYGVVAFNSATLADYYRQKSLPITWAYFPPWIANNLVSLGSSVGALYALDALRSI